MEAPIAVVLADDHVVVRRGLGMLLARERDFEVVAEAGDGDDALAVTLRKRPAVLVLDLNMPGLPSLEVIAALGEAAPEVAVVVLTMEDDPAFAHEALEAGALGFVLKRAAENELVETIRMVAAGGSYVSESLRATLRHRTTASPTADDLTEREREVLGLVALGHTSPEIAERLGIGIRTVETHRTHILQKTAIGSRPELVRYALEHGLI